MPTQLTAQNQLILNTESTFPSLDLEQAVLELVADGIELWRACGFNSYDNLEENYTMRLETCMRKIPSNHGFRISREEPDPTEDMRKGNENARTESHIDIAVHSFSSNNRFFSIECKRVGNSPLPLRYVTKGIDRFVSGKYARQDKAGAMVGYVIEGQIDALIDAINERIDRHLTTGSSHRLTLTNPIRQLQTVYKSNHTRQEPYPHIHLTHFFFYVPQSNNPSTEDST